MNPLPSLLPARGRILLLCLPLWLGAATAGGEEAASPNIVFLLTDDQCTDSLGCYGNDEVVTPHIDGLAREGVAFDNHYNTTAICMASRASIMTGLYEYRHGCNFEHGPLLREHWRKAYPVLLRARGYRTAMAGKIGFTVSDVPGRPGTLPEGDFDAWGAGPGQTHYQTARNPSMAAYADRYPHATLAYGAFGADFIAESAAAGGPFCLSISFKAPHRPVEPDPRFDHVYAGRRFTRPPHFGREHGRHFAPQSREGRQYERFTSWGYADDYDRVMARYHQQIHAVDVAVGMIREALLRHGVADRTVIVFTSDNGFLCGAHGYGSKVLPYEDASRAPLIVLDPRTSRPEGPPRRCRALTGNVDLAPTLLALAGVAAPEGIDGRSLLPLVTAPGGGGVRATLPLINVWGPPEVHSFSVVSPDGKFIYWPWGEPPFAPVEEYYRLAADRYELANAIEDPARAGAVARMRAAYDREVARWKEHAVPYHRYQRFGRIFDRQVPWAQKPSAAAAPGRKRSS